MGTNPGSVLGGRRYAAILFAALLAAPAAWAAEGVHPDLADISATAAGVQWTLADRGAGAVLTVAGPDGTVERVEAAAGGPVGFSAFAADGSRRPDGEYVWELRVVRKAPAAVRIGGDDAEGRTGRVVAPAVNGPDVQSGAFRITNGALSVDGGVEGVSAGAPRRAAAPAGPNQKAAPGVEELAQVFATDLIVQGSECVGVDCTSSESFGFDTIRLKENNLRIKFEDTSVGSFPSTDWQLTANDSASGGANRFSIEDITGAKVPFTVTAGATTNSIFVSSAGRVGLRTATPVLDLHVNTSNTPGLRLEQNSSGGFSAQSWDIAGNEANFFVRDVTNGSRLPFRIRPGAPTSSIDIAADGKVGIGTASPDANLDVESANAFTFFRLTATGASPNTAADTTFTDAGGDGAYRINIVDGDSEELEVRANGNIKVAGTCIQFAGPIACTAAVGSFTCVSGTCP